MNITNFLYNFFSTSSLDKDKKETGAQANEEDFPTLATTAVYTELEGNEQSLEKNEQQHTPRNNIFLENTQGTQTEFTDDIPEYYNELTDKELYGNNVDNCDSLRN